MPPARAIDPSDIEPDLEQRHRDAMLDLVLAWGSLDGALGVLLSDVLGVPLDQGAEQFGSGKYGSTKMLNEVRKALKKAPGGANAASIMKKLKKNYEQFSIVRNRIAHSHCKGVWTCDRNYIVFMKFEKVEANKLALYAIPIQEMEHATNWGLELRDLALKGANASSAEA